MYLSLHVSYINLSYGNFSWFKNSSLSFSLGGLDLVLYSVAMDRAGKGNRILFFKVSYCKIHQI